MRNYGLWYYFKYSNKKVIKELIIIIYFIKKCEKQVKGNGCLYQLFSLVGSIYNWTHDDVKFGTNGRILTQLAQQDKQRSNLLTTTE